MVSITECPRDAMQGIRPFIPTEIKVKYLQTLLEVGFDRLDFGSFVSPKSVPQMRDTADVLSRLDPSVSHTQLLAIIANTRGAQEAVEHPEVRILGFPFSVSETFQLRNTNRTIGQSQDTVREIRALCKKHHKTPLIYLSMGFGNPYGDHWSPGIVARYIADLVELGIQHFALADTIGNATPGKIAELYTHIKKEFPSIDLGLHLHSTPDTSRDKLIAALEAGCDRFDTALRGFGGCPMAEDRLTGNIATETLLAVLAENGMQTNLNMQAWTAALQYSHEVFLA